MLLLMLVGALITSPAHASPHIASNATASASTNYGLEQQEGEDYHIEAPSLALPRSLQALDFPEILQFRSFGPSCKPERSRLIHADFMSPQWAYCALRADNQSRAPPSKHC